MGSKHESKRKNTGTDKHPIDRLMWLVAALFGFRHLLLVAVSFAAFDRAYRTDVSQANERKALLLRGGATGAAPPSSTAQNPALRPPGLLPDREAWHEMTMAEMDENLGCDYDRGLPIHGPEIWTGMREAYVSVVGPHRSTLASGGRDAFSTGLLVPFEVRYSGGRGRGIFAKEAVDKGRVLYDFSQSAQFETGTDFAEFLRILAPELACDVLLWSYAQDLGTETGNQTRSERRETTKGARLRIVTDLDPGSFCNDGGYEGGNTGWMDQERGGASEGGRHPPHVAVLRREEASSGPGSGFVRSAPLVALKDIAKGEELSCVYDQFNEGLGLMID